MSEESFTELMPVVRRLVRRALAASANLVDPDDVRQEALMWLLTHPKAVEEHRDPEQGTLYAGQIASSCWNARLGPWLRREVSAILGRDMRGQSHYDRDKVVTLLPLVLSGAQGSAPIDAAGVRSASDPALGGTMLAVVADLRRAVADVRPAWREAMVLKWGLELSWTATAARLGVSSSAARHRAESGLEHVVDFLNGLYPVPDAGPGTRRVRSNAAARVLTDRGDDAPGAAAQFMS